MEPVRLEIAPEVNLDYVRSDKFKTGTLSVQLITPINEKTASFGALLPSVLRRGTMEHADSLYGVTMKEKGISKILSVNVDEAEKSIREAK